MTQPTDSPLPALLDLMRARRSIRRYAPRAVPRATLDDLFEAARWAPSAHNRQPWRFAVLESLAARQALARAMGDRLRVDLERDGVAPELIAVDTARSYERLTHAPIVVVACVTLEDMDAYPDAARARAEHDMATQSLALALQNFLLAAHASGLGACWLCAPLFVPDTVRRVLALDPAWEPQALVTLGYPAENRVKTRRPMSELVRFLDAAEGVA